MYNYNNDNNNYPGYPNGNNNYPGYPNGNNNYPGYSNDNNTYPPYPYYYQPYYPPPPPPPQKRGLPGVVVFFLLAAVVLVAAYFTSSYLDSSRAVADPLTQDDRANFGFRILPNEQLVNQQYALQKIDAATAWKITQGKSDLIVAVIDTGVDASHPDLQGKLVKGYNFVDNNTNTNDIVGHGTFVASLIAARANDEVGISGIAPQVKIMPLKVMDDTESGNSLRVAKAIRYAVDNGAKVINLSLGSDSASRNIKSAIDYAISKNVVVVAASGNEGNEGNQPNYPASFAGVISVAATGPRDTVAAFSNHNRSVAVSAPGVNVIGARSAQNQICRPYRNDFYCVASGTSFAAPYVSGTVALMLSANAKLSITQVTQILESTSQDLGPSGRDDYYGYGRIDAAKAVQKASTAK